MNILVDKGKGDQASETKTVALARRVRTLPAHGLFSIKGPSMFD